jgi:hypothetical protein
MPLLAGGIVRANYTSARGTAAEFGWLFLLPLVYPSAAAVFEHFATKPVSISTSNQTRFLLRKSSAATSMEHKHPRKAILSKKSLIKPFIPALLPARG